MVGLCLETLRIWLAVERPADAQLAFVYLKRLLVPAGEDEAVLDDRLDVVGRHALHGDLSTLKRNCSFEAHDIVDKRVIRVSVAVLHKTKKQRNKQT